MIFEQLSLEYFLAGRPLSWNKPRNVEVPVIIHDYVTLMDARVERMIKYDLMTTPVISNPNAYFDLKGG